MIKLISIKTIHERIHRNEGNVLLTAAQIQKRYPNEIQLQKGNSYAISRHVPEDIANKFIEEQIALKEGITHNDLCKELGITPNSKKMPLFKNQRRKAGRIIYYSQEDAEKIRKYYTRRYGWRTTDELAKFLGVDKTAILIFFENPENAQKYSHFIRRYPKKNVFNPEFFEAYTGGNRKEASQLEEEITEYYNNFVTTRTRNTRKKGIDKITAQDIEEEIKLLKKKYSAKTRDVSFLDKLEEEDESIDSLDERLQKGNKRKPKTRPERLRLYALIHFCKRKRLFATEEKLIQIAVTFGILKNDREFKTIITELIDLGAISKSRKVNKKATREPANRPWKVSERFLE
ncbi:MAG: hypothetical protein ABIA76_00700 [Candidatus Diapherotrites archaeon]